jgi:hypothetical protein
VLTSHATACSGFPSAAAPELVADDALALGGEPADELGLHPVSVSHGQARVPGGERRDGYPGQPRLMEVAGQLAGLAVGERHDMASFGSARLPERR